MRQAGNQDSGSGLMVWDPQHYVKAVDEIQSKLSRGFLRSRPEKWFPGFSTHWLPLIHSLGVEAKVTEVKTQVGLMPGLSVGFCGTIDDEPVGIYCDANSAQVLMNALSPSAIPSAKSILLEYLARRCLTSLAISWSGPESSVVRFERELRAQDVAVQSAVKLSLTINGNEVQIWFGLGALLTERLDGLWRRQVRSSARQNDRALDVHMEIAQLAVPPSMLAEYMKPGAVVDLEVMASDSITLRIGSGPNSKAWLPARLCSIKGNLGFEVLPGPVLLPSLPEGSTRLSIEFGTLSVDAGTAAEIAQVGAVWDSGLRLGEKVRMLVNAEKVSEALLCTFEGRFAISVG